jgi:hypothetical protein
MTILGAAILELAAAFVPQLPSRQIGLPVIEIWIETT